jgi:hypothetical protein
MTAKLERDVKKEIAALLAKHNAYWTMPVTFGYGASGHPDFVGIVYGYGFGIEAKKTAKQKPTALQRKRLDEITKAGGLSMVIHDENVHQLATLLDSLKDRHASRIT